MKKKLFIDCQILQTAAYSRGMGKYSLSLLSALTANEDFKASYEPVLIFSKNLQGDKEHLDAIKARTGVQKSIIATLPTDISSGLDEKKILAQQEFNRVIKAMTTSSEQINFLSLAPFFVGFPSVFPTLAGVRKITIVYDLIPLLIWKKQRIFPDDIYFDHFKFLFESDVLLSISQAVKDDLVQLLGIDTGKIKNINGGPLEVVEPIRKPTPPEHPYVIYPSAPIIHKNNATAVRGFEIFNKKHDGAYRLLFTSSFNEDIQQELSQISSNLIFTGNVSDQELAMLYGSATAVLFASLSEGLGMPVLEGVLYEKPIACSDIPVLTEMSESAFYLFDPTEPGSIAAALEKAVTGADWSHKHKSYKKVSAKYQWANSAHDCMEAMRINHRYVVNAKKTLEIQAPYPSRPTAQQQLVEQIYARLYADYNVRLSFFGKRKAPNYPSYTQYFESPVDKSDPEIVLLINKKKDKSYPASTKQVSISINDKKLFLRRRTDGTLEPKGEPLVVNKALSVTSWTYKDAKTGQDFRDALSKELIR